MSRRHWQVVLFILIALACVVGFLTPPLALALGIVMALTIGQPYPEFTHRWTKILLQASVVGLGFGMDLGQVWVAGRTGFGFTVVTVAGTMLLGWLVGRLLKVEPQVSCLVSSGTAICGGSAIAAIGAVLDADKRAMSVSLATVFVLNAVALFVFPVLGHYLDMNQEQFGLWAAIAIHDTSSVVGAAAKYGDQALQMATTVKLTRTLWIIPLSLGVALVTRRRGARITIPWFILYFILAAAVRSVLPQGAVVYDGIRQAAKLGLTLTLFFIGCGLSREAVRKVGPRAMIEGVILWVAISLAGLLAVRSILGA